MTESVEPMVEATGAVPAGPWIALPARWPVQQDLLLGCQEMSGGLAMLLIVVGVIYLLFGWHLFRVLVTLNAAVLGATAGLLIAQPLNAPLIGAVLGGFCLGAASWPLIKYAVALMGGLLGLVLGGAVWQMAGQDPTYAWAGAMMGLILLGLLSFIIFRGSVMMFTSMQGAVMLIFGLLGLICKYPQLAGALTEGLVGQPLLLPIAIFIPALVGLIYQQASSSRGEGDTKPAAA